MSQSSGPAKAPRARSPITAEAMQFAASRADVALARAATAQMDARARYDKLANTLERDVIPRLVQAHPGAAPGVQLQTDEVDRFAQLLIRGSDAELNAAVDALYARGLRMHQIYLQLFAPAARQLGSYWDADRCDFTTVTICLGRLQRLLRDWSPVFNQEIQPRPNGRRVLLAQHAEEQHSFGLSMVAEFFRAEGWEVVGGVAGAVPNIAERVQRERFDALGIAAGTDMRIDWVRSQVIRARAASRNRHLVVLVGGPIFLLRPELAPVIGADAACEDGSVAPAVVEQLIEARARVC
jgi:methanogenic corrinoid protein MtbC1